MLKRKIMKDLENWKKNKNNECLLLKGARQVGKTYIVEKFGKSNYTHFYSINFVKQPELMAIFEGNLDFESIIKKLSIYIPNFKFVEKNTLLFLDEIQECGNARVALKFLAQNNNIDVIASGSLLGIKYKNITSVPVGYETQLMMYPLDFEEFLWAIGINENAIEYLKEHFDNKEKIESPVNEEMLKKLREYIVVGGMPDVVNKYIKTNNFFEVHKVQEKVLNDYNDDIIKYATNYEKPKIRKTYSSVPRQLAKENKKFQFSSIEKGSTSRKFEDSVQWLVDAYLVTIVYNVSLPVIPLLAYEKENYYKVYLNDIGLLVAMYGFDTKKTILENTLSGPAKGGIYENLVCDILTKRGYKLNYYKVDDNSQEIEFLIQKDGKVIPIEVKAGNGSSISLNNFIKNYNPKITYKLINGNLGVNDNKITLPLYMAMFI